MCRNQIERGSSSKLSKLLSLLNIKLRIFTQTEKENIVGFPFKSF
jgi:hypothetical protein